MRNVVFKEVDDDNFRSILDLHKTLTDNQKKCVASNVYSIAEASVYPKNAYYRGVFVGDKPIGFIMVYIPSEGATIEQEKYFYLWRFMIAREFQHKGYGSKALDIICDMAKKLGFDRIVTSVELIDEGPLPFYERYGFTNTGRMDEGELVLELIFRK
jgi:diamine N-acetyltransferase